MNVYAPVPHEQIDYWLAKEEGRDGKRRNIQLIKRTTEFREAEQIVGTGPYTLEIFKRKVKIVMERNPDYRKELYPSEGSKQDEDNGLLADKGQQVPFIDVLHYDFVPELSSDWMLFLFKQHDAAPIPTDMFKSIVTPDKELEGEWHDKGIRMTVYKQPEIYWIVFNMEDPILGQCKPLRQGLCAAFDVDSYMKVLKEGRGIRAVNTLPSTFKGWAEAGPGPYYKLDLELAKKKIAEAKKELAAKGLLENGEIPELTIDIGSRDAMGVTQAELFKQQFAKVGVRLKTVLNDWSTQQSKVNNKQSQMYTMGWHADYPDAENFLQLYYTGNIEKQTNNSNYSNPVYDKLYEKVRVMPDTEERTKLYAQMTRIISEDCPHLLLDEPDRFVLYYDWYHNVNPHPVAYGFGKYRRIDPDRRRELGGKEK